MAAKRLCGCEDRRRYRRRPDRSACLSERAAPHLPLGIRRHLERQKEGSGRKTEAQTGPHPPLGLRHRQEQETHRSLLGGEGLPQRRSRRPHRKRFGLSGSGGQRNFRDRQERTGENRPDQLHGQRTVQGQTPAQDLQEDSPEKSELLPQHEAQRKRLRRRQGVVTGLLQLQRLPECNHRARFDLPHQREADRHRHRSGGRQQILHTQRLVGRQLGARKPFR